MSPAFHIANGLFLLSYLVRDILWLRILSVLAQLALLVGTVLTPAHPIDAIAWNTLFLVINVVRIYLLILERRPVKLTQREAHLWELVFRSLTPRELKVLLARGAFRDSPVGDLVVERGKHPSHVLLLSEGKVQVAVEGRTITELGPGSFVGEMSFLTGDTPRADVRTREPCVFFAWPKDPLARMLKDNAELRAHVQMAIGQDLVQKLRAPTASTAPAADSAS